MQWKIACFVLSILAGGGAFLLHVPLAWVLGPLITTAVFSISGTRPFAPLLGRRFGQLVIGTAIGLNLQPTVLTGLLWWLPAMVVSAIIAILFGAALAIALARFGRIDIKTAYYAMMPGGLSEMASIGADQGARSEPIALVQTLRVSVIVTVLPATIVSFGIAGNFHAFDRLQFLPHAEILLLLIASAGAGAIMRFIKMSNPWIFGALIVSTLVAATGFVEGRMPRDIFYVGQFLVGIATGARFRREIVLALPRVAVTGLVLILVNSVLLFAYATLLAVVARTDIASAALATSPGGFSEMTITAELLHLNIALVTTFHIVRALLVNGCSTYFWALFNLFGYSRLAARFAGNGRSGPE